MNFQISLAAEILVANQANVIPLVTVSARMKLQTARTGEIALANVAAKAQIFVKLFQMTIQSLSGQLGLTTEVADVTLVGVSAHVKG